MLHFCFGICGIWLSELGDACSLLKSLSSPIDLESFVA
jgi:hypothetical protein